MQRIGKYQVRGTIVSTGYSTVHLCFDPDLRLAVAVKSFDLGAKRVREDAIYGVAHWRERFVREARLLARLDHPHIVPVKEMGMGPDGEPYFVMPFFEANLAYEIGRDSFDRGEIARLPEAQRPRRLAPARAVALLRQLLAALGYLHRRAIVHRDVKPANVLLTRKRAGAVKLSDFGMVKFPDWSASRAGVWLGTLDYIAPEQRENAAAVDARADVYSSGALAYRLLTGRLPVGRFAPPSAHAPGLPGPLDELVLAALEPEREARPADAGEMLKRLNAAWPSAAAPAVARVVRITKRRVAET